MILSNEPGYYMEGEFGIRIESLVHVTPSEREGMLSLDTMTLVPIDSRLIVTDLLSSREIDCINAYHARIGDEIGPLIKAVGDADLMAWFEGAVAPIG
jgi:Xaa-Pro aminopeptidase